LEAFRLALPRLLFEAGLWTLGGLSEGGVLFLIGVETIFFRCDGRLETRKGTRIE
jgi:hypothetical protein